jgi:hypothetical protein
MIENKEAVAEVEETELALEPEKQAEETTKEETSEDITEETQVAAESKPKKQGGFVKKLAKKDAEIEALKSQLASLAPKKDEAVKAVEVEPKESDFETVGDYYRALAKYEAKQIVKAEKEESEKRSKQEAEEKDYKSKLSSYNERLNEFTKTKADFDEVIENYVEEHGDLKLSGALNQLILKSEEGPAVLYRLVKNKAELDRLNGLDPLDAAKEFGKIEATLIKPKTTLKTTTTAPAPMKSIQGSKATSTGKDPHEEGISFSEYDRRRREQERARLKRA